VSNGLGLVKGANNRTDEKYIELVRTRKQHSEREFQSYYNRIPDWYRLTRGIYVGKFAAFRNNVHIPFIYSVIQSDVARKVQTSFGAWPIVGFEGYPPEEVANAKRNELLVSAQMKDCRSFPKATDFFMCADMYGVGISRHGWKKQVKKEQYRVPYEISPGVTSVHTATVDVTRFEGPDWTVVDPLDFFPQPGFKYIEDMGWVVQRYYLDLDDIREMEKPDDQGNLGYFDVGTADALDTVPMQGGAESEMAQRVSIYRTWGDYNARREEKFAKPVEIWEMWGNVPSEMAPEGVRGRCIAIGNGRKLMKNRPNPYWHGQLPYSCYQVGDPHYFHGVGKCELMAKMQAVSNRLINHKLDGLDLVISPMWVMNGQANVNNQNMTTSPGKIIQTDGPADESTIRAISPDMQGLGAADQGIEQMWRFMQQSSGIVEDTVSGLPSSGRQTAREFQGRQENVMTRLMLEARTAEEQWLEPLANMFRALNRQYLPVPRMVNMLGSMATVNPVTGLPLPAENVPVDHADLWPDYKARAVGATQMMGKGNMQQNMMQMLQAVSTNPVLMQMISWSAFARQMFDAFGLKNVNELLVQQLPAINQVADQTGQSPQGVAGAMSNPSQMDPQMLQNMLQTPLQQLQQRGVLGGSQ